MVIVMDNQLGIKEDVTEKHLSNWVDNCERNLEHWKESLAKTARLVETAEEEYQNALDDLADYVNRRAQGKPQKCRHLFHYNGAVCQLDSGHTGRHENASFAWEG